MKKLVYIVTILLVLFAAGSAVAVPMQYEISFDGPTAGTGTFIWDNDTQLMSDFSWSFGSYSGGVNDLLYPWDVAVSGGNLSQYLFETLTLEDVHPVTCTSLTTTCSVSINDIYGDFDTAYFEIADLNLRRYSFMISNEFAAYGTFTTRLVGTVPAPASFVLLGLGLIGLSFARRNKD